MKAIHMTAVGGPEVLAMVELPTLVPADDELRIRVHAAGVNPIDTMLRIGFELMLTPMLEHLPGGGARIRGKSWITAQHWLTRAN